MSRPRALDLFCRAGGVSEGLRRAGFDVVGVDILDCATAYNRGPGHPDLPNPARFVQADALEFMREVIDGKHGHFDLVCASPPCQAHSTLRHLQAGKTYPDLIAPTRELLREWGGLWCIENVPGAPLGGANLTLLCGSMFGLQTPDGRAELRRHRLFETSFSIPLRPACQHGHVAAQSLSVVGQKGLPGLSHARREALSVSGSGLDSGKERYRRRALSVTGHAVEISPSNWGDRKVLTVTGHTAVENRKVVCVGGGKAMSGGMAEPQGARKRRAMSVTGGTPQTNTVHNVERETFSTADARAAMGIPWMSMRDLSQAIPPAYAEWIGRQAIAFLGEAR